jgi:DNA invertase Pin-like site-specific DNA recombinase
MDPREAHANGDYLRVSTTGQTTENQRLELEHVARQRGWEIVGVYEDAGARRRLRRDPRRPGLSGPVGATLVNGCS